MDTDRFQITASASRAPEAPSGERGAGGKLRKPPPRKPPSTPYARPPETVRRRWISKLVDPAFRLISSGANRILPSFFSTATPDSSLAGPNDDHGKWQTGEQDDTDNGEGHSDDGPRSDLPLWASKPTVMASNDGIGDKLKSSEEKGGQSDENRLSDIEQLMKGHKFSRDEFNRLVNVLNSRAREVPNTDQEKVNTSLTSRKDEKGPSMTHGLHEQRHEESIGAILGSSTPLCSSKVRDEISATPIEIARAYMGSRASEAGLSSKSMTQTVERKVLHGDEGAIQPYDPSTSMKTSTCWPGALVKDAYITPQSERSRYGLHNFPRTPYSRTLLSKSKSRLSRIQDNNSQFSSTPLRQSHNTLYLQDKSKVDASESGYGSIGPIRRIRHNKVGAQSSSRRAAYSSLNSPSPRESSIISEVFTPVRKSSDSNGTSTCNPVRYEVGVPTVHMHTSLMAKKILDHIDRNVPSPKEKSAELKLATKWKNPGSNNDVNTDNDGLLKFKDVSPYKYGGLNGKKDILKGIEGQGNCHVDILPKENTNKSDMNVPSSISRLGDDARNNTNYFGGSQNFFKPAEEDTLKTLPGGTHPEVVNQEKNPLSNSAASKPALPPIAIKKPNSAWNLASDNGTGFTFPVSKSSSAFSEPPTPSIMPFFSTGDQNQSKEQCTELSYSFGSKGSSPPLVFSFPSSSNTVNNDAGDLKFNFGSNEKARLSFSFGKNAVCC